MILTFCAACGSTKELHQHHLVPKSLGGSSEETNLLTLCNTCHALIHGRAKAFSSSELTKRGLDVKRLPELVATCGTLCLYINDKGTVPSLTDLLQYEPELKGILTKGLLNRCLDLFMNDPVYFKEIVFDVDFTYELPAMKEALASPKKKLSTEDLKEMFT